MSGRLGLLIYSVHTACLSGSCLCATAHCCYWWRTATTATTYYWCLACFIAVRRPCRALCEAQLLVVQASCFALARSTPSPALWSLGSRT